MNANEPPKHETVFDDATQHVARVYAEAFLNAAQKSGQTEELVQDLDALVNEVFAADPVPGAVPLQPRGQPRPQGRRPRAAFEGRASDLFVNFLLVLNDHDRLDAAAGHRRRRPRPARGADGQGPRRRCGRPLPLADDQRERLRAGAAGVAGPRAGAGDARRSRPAGRPGGAGRRLRCTTPASARGWNTSGTNSSREAVMRFKADEIVSVLDRRNRPVPRQDLEAQRGRPGAGGRRRHRPRLRPVRRHGRRDGRVHAHRRPRPGLQPRRELGRRHHPRRLPGNQRGRRGPHARASCCRCRSATR